MTRIPLVVCSTLVLVATACEKHPFEGEPPMPAHGAAGEEHHEAKPGETAKAHEEAKPATPEKPGEAPKFFPGKQ